MISDYHLLIRHYESSPVIASRRRGNLSGSSLQRLLRDSVPRNDERGVSLPAEGVAISVKDTLIP